MELHGEGEDREKEESRQGTHFEVEMAERSFIHSSEKLDRHCEKVK